KRSWWIGVSMIAAMAGSMAVSPAASAQASPVNPDETGAVSADPVPRHDLNGMRVQVYNGKGVVFLVFNGTRHRIPESTYHNLFRSTMGVQQVINIKSIPPGGPLSSDAMLARAGN